jgi:hypothetical protein
MSANPAFRLPASNCIVKSILSFRLVQKSRSDQSDNVILTLSFVEVQKLGQVKQSEQQQGGVMISAPRWFLPVAVLAMIWNLLGCAAFLADVTLTHEDVAKMSAAQQALYTSRPAWAVAATAIAVWGGAAGCLGLILRKRWATWLLVASLVGVMVQDVGLFVLSKAASQAGPTVFVLQGLVLLVSVGLVLLARKASARDWIA